MVTSASTVAAALLPNASGRGRRRRPSWPFLMVLCTASMITLSACAMSQSALTMQPAFAYKMHDGIDSVSVRQSIPGMPSEQFVRMVKAGMEQAAPGSVLPGTVEQPFPTQRIVWRAASQGAGNAGVSWLIVNVFNGTRAVANQQETVSNTAPRETLVATIQSMTSRLLAETPAAPS
jgi:hypothetical protein